MRGNKQMAQCDKCSETDIAQFYVYMLRRANEYCLCKRCAWEERRSRKPMHDIDYLRRTGREKRLVERRSRKLMHDIDCSCMICSGVQVVPTPSQEEINANMLAWEELRQQQMEKWKQQHVQMSSLLAEHPDMNSSELGRRVGCSRETARKWKRRFQHERKVP